MHLKHMHAIVSHFCDVRRIRRAVVASTCSTLFILKEGCTLYTKDPSGKEQGTSATHMPASATQMHSTGAAAAPDHVVVGKAEGGPAVDLVAAHDLEDGKHIDGSNHSCWSRE